MGKEINGNLEYFKRYNNSKNRPIGGLGLGGANKGRGNGRNNKNSNVWLNKYLFYRLK